MTAALSLAEKQATIQSPAVEIVEQFPLQSYFDATPETLTPPAMAVLQQPQGEGIARNTLKTASIHGYAIGVAPWSEAPAAIQFVEGNRGQSGILHLRPGQIVRPTGGLAFTGFNWGLPYGWLGGGTVTLFIFKTHEAKVKWDGIQPEILFHRFRTVIRDGASIAPVANGVVNFPTKFPWAKQYQWQGGANSEIQQGQPILSISEITRTILRLQQGATVITGDQLMRMVWFGSDAFSIGADGITAVQADKVFYDLNWPDNVVAGMDVADPLLTLPRELAAVGCNQYGINFYAPTASALIGLNVDVVRWGRL